MEVRVRSNETNRPATFTARPRAVVLVAKAQIKAQSDSQSRETVNRSSEIE